MAVEHAQTPRGQDQQSCTRKENANNLNCQLSLRPREAWRDNKNQKRRRQYPNENNDRDHQGQQWSHRAGHTVRLPAIALRDKGGIDRNKRSGKSAFAEKVLEEIWDSERLVERIGLFAKAEVMAKRA